MVDNSIFIEEDPFQNEWANLSESVMESIQHIPIYKLVEGDVCIVSFPYLNGSGIVEERPAVFMQYPDGKMYMVRCSRLKSAKAGIVRSNRIKNNPLHCLITDIQTAGLSDISIFCTNTYLPLAKNAANYIGYIGHLSDKDFQMAKKMVSQFRPENLSDPFDLMGYMKAHDFTEPTHPSGNNNNNLIQSLSDAIASNSANCVDIASCMHEFCERNKIEHYIVKTDFILNQNKSSGHIYCIFYDKLWYNRYCVFRYFPKDDSHPALCGDIIPYRKLNIASVIKGEEKFLYPEFVKILGSKKIKARSFVCNKASLHEWDKFVDSAKTQKELIAMLNEYNKNSTIYPEGFVNLKPISHN